jgi:hypothetical protein
MLVLLAIYLNIQCRSKTGMDPSILRLIRKRADRIPAARKAANAAQAVPATSMQSSPAE